MVIGIIGENCSGKSTLAEKIKAEFGAEIVTGKDYLRMAKSESEAVSLFREKLRRAVSGGQYHLCDFRSGACETASGWGDPNSCDGRPGDNKRTLQSKNAWQSSRTGCPYAGKKAWDV